MLKRFAILGAAVCLVISTAQMGFAMSAEDMATTINLAGKQRMLTQKMTKETLLVQAGINADANRENLKKTTDLFKKTLTGLAAGDADLGLAASDNDRFKKKLTKVQEMYDALDPLFQKVIGGGELDDTELSQLAAENLPLLKEMNKGVKIVEKQGEGVMASNPELAVVLNLAGKQRMLTQKMSKEFLMVYLGVSADDNKLNLQSTTDLFDKTLNGLINGDADLELPAASGDVVGQLETVSGLWETFKPIVTNTEASEGDVQAVEEQNLPLLKEMNKAVQMFAKQA